MKKFNERIYELRKEHRFTQEEIAQSLNVSRQTISNWETNTAQPTIDKVIELANLYNISIDDLVKNNNAKKTQPSKILHNLLNKNVTVYLKLDSDSFLSIGKATIKNCLISQVNASSIRVIMEEKQQKFERLIFIKDLLSFEMEVN